MQEFEVKIEIENKTYKGSATVAGKVLTVQSFKFGSKSASISSNNEVLARLLLNELVNESNGKGW